MQYGSTAHKATMKLNQNSLKNTENYKVRSIAGLLYSTN